MIVVNLDVMLAKRKMSVTELSRQVGITMANLSILKNGKSKAIRLSTLDAVCTALQCQPGDVLEWRPDGAEQPTPAAAAEQETEKPALSAPEQARTGRQRPRQQAAPTGSTPSRSGQSRKPAGQREPEQPRYLTVDTHGSRLNLRRSDSRNSGVVVCLPSGARVELLERKGSWVRVRWEDKVGWALAAYLK